VLFSVTRFRWVSVDLAFNPGYKGTILTATVKEQAAQIQKVSAQVELSKPAPQVVNNP
jgi:hypothetical protein